MCQREAVTAAVTHLLKQADVVGVVVVSEIEDALPGVLPQPAQTLAPATPTLLATFLYCSW